MQKNVASQKWVVFAFEDEGGTNPGEPVTGDAANITANLRIDGGAANAVDDVNPTELEDGYYIFDITAAESNGENIVICPASSTANVNVIGCPGALYTTPANFPDFSVTATDGRVDVAAVAGTAQTANDNGADINAILVDTNSLNDTKIPQTLNLTASGNIGIDWANVENPTTAVDLSATDIQLVDTCTTNTDMRGTDSAATASALATVDSNVDAILVDTGTTLDTKLNDIQGATFSSATDSLEAIRDRGDAAWITGGGGGLTQSINPILAVPPTIDLADTASVRIGIILTNTLDDLPTSAEITPGTITISRKAQGGTSWSNVVSAAAMSEQDGFVYYDEVFDSGTGYAVGDMIRIQFESVSVTADANTYNITGATGVYVYSYIMEPMRGTDSAATATALATAQADLDTITGADGATLASTQGNSITFQPVTITAGDANPNITLAGSGTEDGIAFTRSGSGDPFDANIMAQINAEIDTALTDYDAATGTELAAVDTKIDTIDTNVDSILADTADMQPKLGTPAGADISADIAAVKTDTAATLVDTGTTLPSTLATIDTNVDSILVDTASLGITKNAAFPNLEFLMVDETDHVTPETGLTVTGQRSIDGGAFASISGSIAEVSNGIYQVDLLAADTNGDVITYRFSAAGAADTFITFKTRA